MLDLVKRYSGETGFLRARAAVRPIIRRSQPVAGPIPGLNGQFVFSGLGSKGVTTSPWAAAQLAEHLVHGAELPPDLLPARYGNNAARFPYFLERDSYFPCQNALNTITCGLICERRTRTWEIRYGSICLTSAAP